MKYLFVYHICYSVCGALLTYAFNPFMDQDLHSIDWVGSSELDKVVPGDNVIVMKTVSNEKYTCVLPENPDSRDEIESYWTYELCHGRYLRQYHEEKEMSAKKPKGQEYYLGYFGQYKPTKGQDLMKELEEKLKPQEIKSKRIDDIELPYYEVNMTQGTECDLNKQPRQVRILYICQPDGRGEIYELKETSTCEYEVLVLTSVLCENPKFKPKNPPVSKIACHAMDGSPARPRDLDSDFQKHPYAKSYTGTGWWKHEFCFGKYARQFHDDPEGRTVIYLGQWNEKKHLEWVSKNPSKMPKEKGKRKCVENNASPHSVSIYLIEPKTCEYIMGIESPLFCSILDRADEYGSPLLLALQGKDTLQNQSCQLLEFHWYLKNS
uniref:Endoplasmic reticulum lectin 1 n=1 Tax=Magallana gigas TaxID=29159 RepID=K1QSM0_MAGGI